MPSLDVSRAVPPLVYDLKAGGGVYYIFDDMNLRFEHAVVAGEEGERWSSTHRVVKEGGRLEDVLGECWRGVEDCRKMWRVMVVLEVRGREGGGDTHPTEEPDGGGRTTERESPSRRRALLLAWMWFFVMFD